MDKINSQNYFEELCGIAKVNNHLFHDQNVLNGVFNASVKLLNTSWNILIKGTKIDEFLDILIDIKILHFCSYEKPWNSECLFQDIWWKYAKNSPYYATIISVVRKFLKEDYTNLLLVDILCYGVCKNSIFREYVEKLELDLKSKIISMNMRYKHRYILEILTEDGQFFTDDTIIKDKFIQPNYFYNMCKKCNMHNSNNVSDMTIGDFWDIGKYIPFLNKNFFQKNGISHIKINTLKGKNV